jgi:hypothetical protein
LLSCPKKNLTLLVPYFLQANDKKMCIKIRVQPGVEDLTMFSNPERV